MTDSNQALVMDRDSMRMANHLRDELRLIKSPFPNTHGMKRDGNNQIKLIKRNRV